MVGNRDRLERPSRNPPGWMDLSDAFQYFGSFAIGMHWHSIPLALIAPTLNRGASAFGRVIEGGAGTGMAKLDGTPQDFADVFVYPVGLWFGTAARTGRIRTAWGRKGGGDLTPLPGGWWRTDDPMLRFRTGCIDPDAPFSDALELPCWIFVHLDDLSAVREEVAGWSRELPHIEDVARDGLEDGADCIAERTAISARLSGSTRRGELKFAAPHPPMFREGAFAAPLTAANDQDPSNDAQPGLVAARRQPHRPAKWPHALRLFAERLRSGAVKQGRMDEARQIERLWGEPNPGRPESIAGWIAAYHDRTRWDGAKLLNGGEVAAIVEADLAEKG